MFLEIHTDRRRKNAYSYGLFRETFRENGQVRHRTRGRVTGLGHERLAESVAQATSAVQPVSCTASSCYPRPNSPTTSSNKSRSVTTPTICPA